MANKHFSESRTEDVVMELLDIQGWITSRPPKGNTVRKNEYKTLLHFAEMFKGKSKTGCGDAYPDFLLVDSMTALPKMVIETKADEGQLEWSWRCVRLHIMATDVFKPDTL